MFSLFHAHTLILLHCYRISTFESFKKSRFPVDHHAYAWLLEIAFKVFSSPNADNRRKEFVTEVYTQCCNDGLFSSTFLKVLTDGSFYNEGWTKEQSVELCTELFGDPPCFVASWSRNLKDKALIPRSQ